MRRSVLLLAISFAAQAAAQAPAAASNDSARIAALEQRIEDANVRRDVAFLDSVYAPEFRFKHATGQLEDRARRMQSLQATPRPGAVRTTSRTVDSLDVEVHGDVALATGRIHIKRDGPPTPTRDYTIRYARVYVRRDGRWQLLTHHSTDQTFDLPAAIPAKTIGNLSAGSAIEQDSAIAVNQPGPHNGGGPTTASSFFAKIKDLELVFRKRTLHPGSAIGYHEQKEDEIYYVVSGQGDYTLDGTHYTVRPGMALLTRPGSSHGMKPIGNEDLVLLISYMNEGARKTATQAAGASRP